MKINEIEQMLTDNNIDYSNWWTGSTKSLESLLNEINDWESSLEVVKGILTRVVKVVWAEVKYESSENKKFRLIEEKQVFKNGSERTRDYGWYPLWEKMKMDEEPIGAMRRWIQEELWIMDIIDIEYDEENEDLRKSKGYPDLLSQYIRYYFTINLRDNQFNKDWYIEIQEDKKTYFSWEEE